MARLFSLLTALALFPAIWLAEPARADEGGTSWGYAKTYQNNWNSDCQWWDTDHDFGGPYGCYQGVWSDTTKYTGSAVSVYEYASRQIWGFWPGETGTYVYYAEWGSSPSVDSDASYAATNEYYCGDYYGSCAFPDNVIGHAYHYNNTGNTGSYLYTESVWGCQYVEIGSFC